MGARRAGGAKSAERSTRPEEDTVTADSEMRGSRPYSVGYAWEGDDPARLAEVIDAAFDYRGDVTLVLESGEQVIGFLANRQRETADAYVELLPADGGAKRRIAYGELRGVVFSGRDPASGKSWETWVKTYEAKKAARARGEETGEIGLYPDAPE